MIVIWVKDYKEAGKQEPLPVEISVLEFERGKNKLWTTRGEVFTQQAMCGEFSAYGWEMYRH